jgi:hypothetical protein
VGVYVLIGHTDDDDLPQVYIGESDGFLRIPRDGGHDSMLMADSVPPSSRPPFHGDGGHHSILKADTPAVS